MAHKHKFCKPTVDESSMWCGFRHCMRTPTVAVCRECLEHRCERHAEVATEATEAARLLGRKGGKARAASVDEAKRKAWSRKGGKALAAKYTPEERSERARAAAKARWAKRGQELPRKGER